MNRWMIALFAALAAIWLLPVNGYALGFGVSGSREEQSLKLQVDYDGTYGKVSACVFVVSFDSGMIDFVDTQEISGGYLVSTLDGNELRTVYSSWEGSEGLGSVSFEFKARKGADTTDTRIEVSIEQVAAREAVQDIPPVGVEYQGRPGESSEAKLLSLSPSDGELEPEFSPDITQYKVSVPYSVEEMNFGLSASPGAKVSVNRRKLGSGGSDTLFRLTVTAEDGVTKQVYSVDVHRGEYIAPTPKPTATPKPTNTPKPTATPKPTKTPKPTGTPKASATPKPVKTPKPSATPKPTKTPKPSATPKPSKTPKPTATPKASGTPKASPTAKPVRTPVPAAMLSSGSGGGPGGGEVEETPLTEVVTVERKGEGAVDRLSAAGGFFVAVFGAAAGCTFLYEKVGSMREEQLKGRTRK